MKLKEAFQRNKKWISNKLKLDSDYFRRLSEDQSPEVMYLGCSDSRVAPENFMGAQPGEIFVYRNIANQVKADDSSINAVIQFSVEFLKVKHIVLCGHYGCGGVKAAIEPTDMESITHWMKPLRELYLSKAEEFNVIKDEELRENRLVELNVIEQAHNLSQMDCIQKARARGEMQPKLHGWVFNLNNGELIDLNLDLG